MMKKITKLTLLFIGMLCAIPAQAQVLSTDYWDQVFDPTSIHWMNVKGETVRYVKDDLRLAQLDAAHITGEHWTGDKITDITDTTKIFLVNKLTNEYFVLGDYWGTTTMTDYTGMPMLFKKATAENKANNGKYYGRWAQFSDGTWANPDDLGDGYWIGPSGEEYTAMGRVNKDDGVPGSFEHKRYIVARDRKEYYTLSADNIETTINGQLRQGGFRWFLKQVPSADGKIYYAIFTRRWTDKVYGTGRAGERAKLAEYGGRDSYLCLRSEGTEFNGVKTDYNVVRFHKFAGDMGVGGDDAVKEVTLSDGTDDYDDNNDAVKNEDVHQYGTYSGTQHPNVSGRLSVTTFTTNATSGMEGLVLTVDSACMAPAWYTGTQHTIAFRPQDNVAHKVKLTAPEGYCFTYYELKVNAADVSGVRNFKMVLQGHRDSVDVDNTQKTYKKEKIFEDSLVFVFKGETGINSLWEKPLCFSRFNVKLMKKTDAPIEDEWENFNPASSDNYVTLDAGLTALADDPASLWKIVTNEDRQRYRLVGSPGEPVNSSYAIRNHKFFTSYTYNFSKSEVSGSNANANANTTKHADMGGWYWYDSDADQHAAPTSHHVHPYDVKMFGTPDNPTYSPTTEFHKIGTGSFWHYGLGTAEEESGQIDAMAGRHAEQRATYGIDANFVGSIFHGSAALQQTITGLIPGKYLVICRAFYAPHHMGNFKATGKELGHLNIPASVDYGGNKVADEVQALTAEDETEEIEGKTYVTSHKGRSHDSYLYAWSKPASGKEDNAPEVEVRAMLPSIYEGLMEVNDDNMLLLSKEPILENMDELKYMSLGSTLQDQGMNGTDYAGIKVKDRFEALMDTTVFAYIKGSDIPGYESDKYYVVPKNAAGAGRFFNIKDESSRAYNYRVELPVRVGEDRTLTLGIDHTKDGVKDYEWVAFDDFELLYLGPVSPEEFFIDEEHPFNNSVCSDIFYETVEADKKDVKNRKVVIHRTLTKNDWNMITLPIDLMKKHIQEAFGENCEVAQLKRLQNKVLYFDDIDLSTMTDSTIVMKKGEPYVIKPTINPIVAAGNQYERNIFSGTYDESAVNDARGRYVPGLNRDRYIKQKFGGKINGPIYVIETYGVKKADVFPGGVEVGADRPLVTVDAASVEWKKPEVFRPNQDKMTIVNAPEEYKNKKYALTSTGFYNPTAKYKPEYFDKNKFVVKGADSTEVEITINQEYRDYKITEVPKHSYVMANGRLTYIGEGVSSINSKGFRAYVQLLEVDEDNNYIKEGGTSAVKPYPHKIMGNDAYLFVVDNDEPTGIDIKEVNKPFDGRFFDLQGRPVPFPKRGVYIVNGDKIVVQ